MTLNQTLVRPWIGLAFLFLGFAGGALAQSNFPPAVQIVTPFNGATFRAPVNIAICAAARDRDGHVVSVEFFAGSDSLGIKTNGLCLVWSNAPAGEYTLTAKATDDHGASGTSAPVRIVVRTAPDLPVVTILAHNEHAAEGRTNTGTFLISRSGGTNQNADLTVNYRIGGTASNGVDYAQIGNSVTIPGGASSAFVTITPVDDNLVERTETVILTLQTNAEYRVGLPSAAVVFIEDNDRITNARPVVHITSPTNGAAFVTPANISIVAQASDADDAVARVDFFANEHLVGRDIGTNKPSYSVVWSNALRGLYVLKAVATDIRGGVGISELARISITGTNPPPTNPPVVTIFASDPIAAEGTNFWSWHTNNHGTNWVGRTNTATFVVRRSSATNGSLTVSYEIGGTASNGVDYVAIPNEVIIAAGQRTAIVTIVPIDDTNAEPAETVILHVLQPTNASQPYVVGWPGRAAALIVDNDGRPPRSGVLRDGTFQLSVPAADGAHYRLECSVDLIHWLPVGSGAVTDLGVHFVDPEAVDFPQRFYRVVQESLPPGKGLEEFNPDRASGE